MIGAGSRGVATRRRGGGKREQPVNNGSWRQKQERVVDQMEEKLLSHISLYAYSKWKEAT